MLGPFLHEMSKLGPVHAFHLVEDHALDMYASRYRDTVQWHKLVDLVDTPATNILRRSIGFAQMYWVDSPPMRLALELPIYGGFRAQVAGRVSRLLGRACASPSRMAMLERAHVRAMANSPQVAHFRKKFQEIKPDVVFCSHQRPPQVSYPIIAARQLGIPTSTFVFSWDNLSSKGRFATPFDHFLLWSEHMRKELFRFFPDVTPERTHVVGTPQFDPYKDESLAWSREEFFARIGADPKRKLICFSGGDEDASRSDQYHVRALMEMIRSGHIKGNPQVFLRPAPVDKGTRYDAIRKEYPELLYARPQWLFGRSEITNYLMPKPEDVQFLANLTRHADINVNFASTMTLDFSIHDKPVVNCVFEVTEKPLFPNRTLWEFVSGFEHYQPVVQLGAAKMAYTREQFADHINAYLADPSLDREGRRKFVELEISVPVGQSSARIAETLQRIAGRTPAASSSAASELTASRR